MNWKAVLAQVNPLRFRELANKPFLVMVGHVSKLLLFATILMFFISLPALIKLPSYFDSQFGKFEALSLTGELKTTEPVYIPDHKPQLVIDTSGTHSTMRNERFLITNEGLFYRSFNKVRQIAPEEFNAMLENKTKMSTLLTLLTIFLIPSIFFFLYGFFWVKYLITIFIFGTAFYILLDLTHFRLGWKHMMGVAGYASFPMILLEVLSLPINTDYLVPVLQLWGVNLYLIPLIFYAVTMLIATTMVSVKKTKKQEEF